MMFMPFVFDIFILIVLIFSVMRGVKKGLINTAFGIMSFLLAGILAFAFYVPFTNYVASTSVGEGIKNAVHTYVYNGVTDSIFKDKTDADAQQASSSDENTEQDVKSSEGLIDALKLPEFIRESIYRNAEFMIRNAAMSAVDAVSGALAFTVFRLICSIVLFLILVAILFVIKKLLTVIFKLPVFNAVNKITGGFAGFVKGALAAYILIALIGTLNMCFTVKWISNTLDNSVFYSAVGENNFIARMFSKSDKNDVIYIDPDINSDGEDFEDQEIL